MYTPWEKESNPLDTAMFALCCTSSRTARQLAPLLQFPRAGRECWSHWQEWPRQSTYETQMTSISSSKRSESTAKSGEETVRSAKWAKRSATLDPCCFTIKCTKLPASQRLPAISRWVPRVLHCHQQSKGCRRPENRAPPCHSGEGKVEGNVSQNSLNDLWAIIRL